MTPILFQNIAFVVYLVICYMLFGITSSISNTWYKWIENKYWRWIFFSLFCVCIGAPAFYIVEQTGNELYGISGILLCFLGVFGAFKISLIGVLHNVVTWGSVGTAMLALWLDGAPEGFLGAAICILLLRLSKAPNFTYWAEVACFVWIQYGLIKTI